MSKSEYAKISNRDTYHQFTMTHSDYTTIKESLSPFTHPFKYVASQFYHSHQDDVRAKSKPPTEEKLGSFESFITILFNHRK